MSLRTYLALGSLLAAFSSYGLTNGNFETGDITGWTGLGLSGALPNALTVVPTEGSYMGVMDNTGNGPVGAPVIAGALGVPGASLIGLSTGTPTNGSCIYQDITVSAGDTLTFDWNFLTDELNEDPQYNDFAIFSIATDPYLLRDKNTPPYIFFPPMSAFDGQTGWATQSHVFSIAGTYRLGFAVFNVEDTGHDSWLLVDNVIVPEPACLLIWPVLLLGRRRQTASQ